MAVKRTQIQICNIIFTECVLIVICLRRVRFEITRNIINQKLKIQNEKLRSQLKELSYKLTETLEKVKNKKNPDRGATEFRDDTLRKELDNANKQLQYYQKEIEKFKNQD